MRSYSKGYTTINLGRPYTLWAHNNLDHRLVNSQNFVHSDSMRVENLEACKGCLYFDSRISSGANIKGDTPYCKLLRTAIKPSTVCLDGPVMRRPITNGDWIDRTSGY